MQQNNKNKLCLGKITVKKGRNIVFTKSLDGTILNNIPK